VKNPKDLASHVAAGEYEFLGNELKLTVEQIEKIAEIRAAGTQAILSIVDAHMENEKELVPALSRARSEIDARIRELLGEEKFEHYREFRGGKGEVFS
jgi:hypothetical protein